MSHDETVFLAFRIVCGLFGAGFLALALAGFTSLLKLTKPRPVQKRKRTADEVHESWLKMAERRGMSYEWLQEAKASHEDIKRRAAWAKGN